MPLGQQLVLQVLDDVAALTVELEYAAAPGHHFHRLADIVVVAHPVGPLLVGHKHLVGLDAHFQSLGQAVQDVGPVLQDEVEAEVGEGSPLDFLAGAVDGFGQGFIALQVVGAERDQGGQAGMGGGQRPQGIVVVAVQVDVAVNQPRQDVHTRSVNIVISRGQQVLRPNGGNLLAVNGDRRRINLG